MQPIVRPVVRCDGPEQDVKRLIGKRKNLKAGILTGLFVVYISYPK